MMTAKKTLPVIFVLAIILGVSYYLFSIHRPNVSPQVRGSNSEKGQRAYLDTLPLPSESREVGRNARDGFSQITVSSLKPSSEIQDFYKNVLTDKGWKGKNADGSVLSTVYVRGEERVEISVLSFDGEQETIFSVSHSE